MKKSIIHASTFAVASQRSQLSETLYQKEKNYNKTLKSAEFEGYFKEHNLHM